MFHSTELEGRNQYEVELPEAVRDACVFFKPVQRRCVKIENSLLIAFDLFRVRFAMEHPIPAAVTLRAFYLKLAGRKREQVRRNGLCFRVTNPHTINGFFMKGFFGVRYSLPFLRNSKFEIKTRLQIRLVKAGKRQVSARRHKQRVHEVRTAVQRSITRTEDDLDSVFLGRKLGAWDNDVILDQTKM